MAAARCALILSSTVLMSSTDYLKTSPHLAFTPAIISSKRRWKDSQVKYTRNNHMSMWTNINAPCTKIVCLWRWSRTTWRKRSKRERNDGKKTVRKKSPITKQSRRGGEKLYVTIYYKKKQCDDKSCPMSKTFLCKRQNQCRLSKSYGWKLPCHS